LLKRADRYRMQQFVVVRARGARFWLEGWPLLLFAGDHSARRQSRSPRLRAPTQGVWRVGVCHQVHELVADRSIEHPAIAEHEQRQQVQFVVEDRAGGEPGQAGDALVVVGGGVESGASPAAA